MGDEDEYDLVKTKPLKLKNKEKKKHDNTTANSIAVLDTLKSIPDDAKVIITTSTKAEETFRAKQDKIAEERILKKASKTHKQRVEEFNKHLDSLSEHYDIPKVSWTK